MNQIKIGNFLKELRKEKGLTQEQLAEHFNISGRTVSRWETGNNMPDLSILVEMSEFYGVGIQEIIDGGRKSEIVNEEIKETLEKVADYSNEYSRKRVNRVWRIVIALLFVLLLVILFIPTKLHFDGTGLNSAGDVSNVITKEVSSDIYSKEDIDSAILVIKDEFRDKWSGCILKEIYYSGDEYSADFADFAKRYNADEVIVLLSSFYAEHPGGNSALNSDFTYTDWNWILVRSKGGKWEHVDHGY